MSPHRFLAGIGALCGTAVYVLGTILYYAASRLAERKPDADAEARWARVAMIDARRRATS